jgi:glutamine amidotransferase PdxT
MVVQLNSFEVELPVPALASQEGGSETCRAVFIRAPAIVDVGPSVEVLAEYPLASGQAVDAPEQVLLFFSSSDSHICYHHRAHFDSRLQPL